MRIENNWICLSLLENENKDEPVFEQASYSDLINKYYLDTNLSCDVSQDLIEM